MISGKINEQKLLDESVRKRKNSPKYLERKDASI